MNNNLVLGTYCIAMGFSLSACVALFYQWVTNEVAGFVYNDTTFGALLMSIAVCVLGGPYIFMRRLMHERAQRRATPESTFVSLFVIGVWSLTSGTFFTSAIILTGIM